MRHGVYATFLAKPMENEPGSAMHIHQSLVNRSDGSNVFAGEGEGEGEFSPVFGHYLGGLQAYAQPVRKTNTSMSHLWISDPNKPGVMARLFSTHPPIADRVARLTESGRSF